MIPRYDAMHVRTHTLLVAHDVRIKRAHGSERKEPDRDLERSLFKEVQRTRARERESERRRVEIYTIS